MSYQPQAPIQPEVFNTDHKLKAGAANVVLTLGLFFVPFFGGLGLTAVIGEAFGDAAGITAIIGTFILGGVGIWVGHEKVILVLNGRLRKRLAAALERRLGFNPDDGRAWFVGWSSGAGANIHNMLETDQDVGFLSLTPDVMTYLGDTTTFQLQRQQVTEIRWSREGIPLVMDMGSRVTVYWLSEYAQTSAFSFERREGTGRSDVRRKTKELAGILQQWHQGGATAG